MEFIHLFSGTDGRAEEIYQSYCHAFPKDERRNQKQFLALFTNPNVKFFEITNQEESVGYLITWKFPEFYFIEHFEIFEGYRGSNLGSTVLHDFALLHPKLILETEPENLNETARRRVQFYKKSNFSVIDEHYIQPPYDENKQPLNLFLMSNFKVADVQKVTQDIHQVVYH